MKLFELVVVSILVGSLIIVTKAQLLVTDFVQGNFCIHRGSMLVNVFSCIKPDR